MSASKPAVESEDDIDAINEAKASRGECVWLMDDYGPALCITRNCREHNPVGYARMTGETVE